MFTLNSFTKLPKRKLGQIYHEPHTQITHASPIQSQGAASRKLIIGTRSSITRVMSGARCGYGHSERRLDRPARRKRPVSGTRSRLHTCTAPLPVLALFELRSSRRSSVKLILEKRKDEKINKKEIGKHKLRFGVKLFFSTRRPPAAAERDYSGGPPRNFPITGCKCIYLLDYISISRDVV